MAKSWFKSFVASAFVVFFAVTGRAEAAFIPYASPGIENPVLYTFTAAADGDVVAYFHSSGASYENEITLLINGVATGIQGLNNQTSAAGDSLNFGAANAGDVLVFKLIIIDPATVGPWFSDKSLNSDGTNHIYSTAFTAEGSIPNGTYVAFEDLDATTGTDFNYNDENFVFVNVATQVPLPGTLLLLALGLFGAGFARRKAA